MFFFLPFKELTSTSQVLQTMVKYYTSAQLKSTVMHEASTAVVTTDWLSTTVSSPLTQGEQSWRTSLDSSLL